ncbi:MAG: DUF2809 domain-containing protein [Flavobacterium sp.]|nr:DUF2809 domain-containing protein [Flavobacterium sp.]
MQKSRFYYFSLAIFIVFLGIGSRKISLFPLFIGDILYAILVYFGMRFLFIHWKLQTIFALSLSFCFLIEISQLFQYDWLLELRKTTFGKYVLGQGFLWFDLVCYIFGSIVAYFSDNLWFSSRINQMHN